MRESKGIGKFSLGGGLEGKLIFFVGGGGGGAGVFLWDHGKPWHIPRESNLFPLDHTNFNFIASILFTIWPTTAV